MLWKEHKLPNCLSFMNGKLRHGEIICLRSLFFFLIHTQKLQRGMGSFSTFDSCAKFIFLHVLSVFELHFSSHSHIYKNAVHRTAVNRICQVCGSNLTYLLWVVPMASLCISPLTFLPTLHCPLSAFFFWEELLLEVLSLLHEVHTN